MRCYYFKRALSTNFYATEFMYCAGYFQCIMDTILSYLRYSCVQIYLDNINVFSRTLSEHLEHLEQVFIRLAKNNLKLKPKKCHFFID